MRALSISAGVILLLTGAGYLTMLLVGFTTPSICGDWNFCRQMVSGYKEAGHFLETILVVVAIIFIALGIFFISKPKANHPKV